MTIEADVERLLRRHGLTSTGSDTNLTIRLKNERMFIKYGEKHLAYSPGAQRWIIELTGFNGQRMELDGMNLQFTREINNEVPEPQIVDFGSFWYKTAFVNSLASLVACRPVRLGEVIHPNDPRFVQPDPAVMPPASLWNKMEDTRLERWGVSCLDAQEAITDKWALDFRDGRLSGAQVAEKLDEYLAGVPGWQDSSPESTG